MGLLSNIVKYCVEKAVDGVVESTVVALGTVTATAAKTAIDATEKVGKVVKDGFDVAKPTLVSVGNSIGKSAKSLANKYQVAQEQKNIKNTFKGKNKDSLKLLINCDDKTVKTGLITSFDIYNENMETICRVECYKKLASYIVTIIDSDGKILIEVTKKGLATRINFIDSDFLSSDYGIEDRIKNYDCNTNILTKTSTYKIDKNIIAYSIEKKEYVGGQFLLDIVDTDYLIPLIIQEVIRETKLYK